MCHTIDYISVSESLIEKKSKQRDFLCLVFRKARGFEISVELEFGKK
jgi:hypothetical protein